MMNKMLKSILCAILVSLSVNSAAALRQYTAKVENSDWQLKDETRLQCTLSHKLPGYGEAMFSSFASKQLNMEFELDMLRLPKSYGVAAVYSVPPKWMPGQVQRTIADMTIRKQYNGDLPEQAAWTMLSELEKGFWPTIYYQDWYNQYDKVAVGLNASNFAVPYTQFAECVANLLPYSFQDIAYTVLNYQFNNTKLTKYSQKRLAMIGEYLKEDTDLELVLLDGYTDSYGGREINKQISVRRAVEIKAFFSSMGVAPERIEITGHGERRHVSSNANESTRAKNRRVVIRMSKP
ncbi:flagellar protein MotY [Paraglaciecola arctica]|uniref:Sodium-type flagellar protein motY n=1 Tax=Paraglaciecola arctica BSs20135 TaxID=493475 RepID=K6YAD1_9ALTE|nr:OmpA family protein [Paraglaciecola arctica]GAC20881.1 sodium-type flagellar protein motY [Paraglaciecola arctica BSs20135]